LRFLKATNKRVSPSGGNTCAEFLEDTYQHTVAGLESVPTPSAQVIANALDMMSAQYPQAKQTDPNLIVDPSFVRWIDQSGFITALYKK